MPGLEWRVYRAANQAYKAAHYVGRMIGVRTLRIGGRTVGELVGPVIRRALARGWGHRPVLVRGHRMFLYEQGDDIAGWLVTEDYEPGTTALIERLLREGIVVVDAGAHVGYYTLLAARGVGNSGRVYAFEPESRNFELLVKNVQLNGYTNVMPIRKALSNRSGVASLYLQGTAQHSLYRSPSTERAHQSVELITLDEFLEAEGWPDVRLVKVDIEGGEPIAIEGMRRLIERSKELCIIVEFAPAHLRRAGTEPEALIRRLQALGFTLHAIDDRKGLRPFDVERDVPRLRYADSYVNLLCQKRERRSNATA